MFSALVLIVFISHREAESSSRDETLIEEPALLPSYLQQDGPDKESELMSTGDFR